MNAGKKGAALTSVAPAATQRGNDGRKGSSSDGAGKVWENSRRWLWDILGDSARVAFWSGLRAPESERVADAEKRPYANREELLFIFQACPEIREFFFSEARGTAYLFRWAELAKKINDGWLRSVPDGWFPVRIHHNIKELAYALGIRGTKKDFQATCFPDEAARSASVNPAQRKWRSRGNTQDGVRKAVSRGKRAPDLDYWIRVLDLRCDFGDPKITTLRQAIESLEAESLEAGIDDWFWNGLRSYLIDLNDLLSHDWDPILALEQADIGKQISGDKNITREACIALLLRRSAKHIANTEQSRLSKTATQVRPRVQDSVANTLADALVGARPWVSKSTPKPVSANRRPKDRPKEGVVQTTVAIQPMSLWEVDRVRSALMMHDSETRAAVRTVVSCFFKDEVLPKALRPWLAGASILCTPARIVVVFPLDILTRLLPYKEHFRSGILSEFTADTTPVVPVEVAGITIELTEEMREFQSDTAEIAPFKVFGFSRNTQYSDAERIYKKILKEYDPKHDSNGTKGYARIQATLVSAWKNICNQQGWEAK